MSLHVINEAACTAAKCSSGDSPLCSHVKDALGRFAALYCLAGLLLNRKERGAAGGGGCKNKIHLVLFDTKALTRLLP